MLKYVNSNVVHYHVKISKQSIDISFVFRRIRNSYIQFVVAKLSTYLSRNVNMLSCSEIIKYNLIITNKYNQEKH